MTQEELFQHQVQVQLLLHPPSSESMGPFFLKIAMDQKAWQFFRPTEFLKIVELFFEDSTVGLLSIQLGIPFEMPIARN